MIKTIKTHFIKGDLYINGVKANQEDLTRLIKEIENGTQYTTNKSDAKLNIKID